MTPKWRLRAIAVRTHLDMRASARMDSGLWRQPDPRWWLGLRSLSPHAPTRTTQPAECVLAVHRAFESIGGIDMPDRGHRSGREVGRTHVCDDYALIAAMSGWTPMMFGDACITVIGAIVRPAIGLPEWRRPEDSISISLSSADVDLVRTRTIDLTHVKPLEALADFVKDFLPAGGTTWAGTPCVKTRGYVEDDLLEGVIVSGASTMHELIQRAE